MLNIKTIITLLLGISIGIGICSLFKGCGDNPPEIVTLKKNKLLVIENKAEKAEVHFQKQMDLLETTSVQLNKKLSSAKQKLTVLKNKNIALQTQVYDLIDRKQGSSDTLIRYAGCDSLKEKITQLLNVGIEKDSLYESISLNLESQIKNRDSTIEVKGLQYGSLKSSFEELLTEQRVLSEQNKVFHKHFRRQKIKTKLLTVAMLLLSGAAANYLIHH